LDFTVKSAETRQLRLVDWRLNDRPEPLERAMPAKE
jgi:hypothetical protein